MTKAAPPNELSAAALALDRELRRFEDLAAQAAQLKLNSEKNLERATEALSRAAESQDRIGAHVQELVEAITAAREKQERDASALMSRAQEIAARRAQFVQLLQRMAGLGQMAREIQELLQSDQRDVAEVQARMDKVAEGAGEIGRAAQEQEMEELARQAETLRQQVLAARNKLGLLAKKG